MSDIHDDMPDEMEQAGDLVKQGHTRHCASRIVWGDGQCECNQQIGKVSQQIIEVQEQSPVAPRVFPLLSTGRKIPWSVAERAYEVYSKRYGTSQSLERLAQRGGFAAEELDDMIPGWREEVEEIYLLRAELAKVREERDRIKEALIDHCASCPESELSVSACSNCRIKQALSTIEG